MKCPICNSELLLSHDTRVYQDSNDHCLGREGEKRKYYHCVYSKCVANISKSVFWDKEGHCYDIYAEGVKRIDQTAYINGNSVAIGSPERNFHYNSGDLGRRNETLLHDFGNDHLLYLTWEVVEDEVFDLKDTNYRLQLKTKKGGITDLDMFIYSIKMFHKRRSYDKSSQLEHYEENFKSYKDSWRDYACQYVKFMEKFLPIK